MGSFDSIAKFFKSLGSISIKVDGKPAKVVNESTPLYEWRKPCEADAVEYRLQKLRDRRQQWSKVRPSNDWRKR